MVTQNVQRRNDLDWIRVLAILAVFVFHSTRPFDTDDWSLKNATTYLFVDGWKLFALTWGMPLILLVSGGSAFYALGKVRPGRYALGTVTRLLVPFLVGLFTHIVWQLYLERRFFGDFTGSFFDFYPHFFEGLYGFGGNFAWMGLHLWYLEALFIFSLLCLPLFAWFRFTAIGRRVLKFLGDVLALPGFAYLLAVPAILLIYRLDPQTWGLKDLGGWSIVIYPLFFISGFVIFSHSGLQARIQALRRFSLGLGVALGAVYLFLAFQTAYPQLEPLWGRTEGALTCLVSWTWLLAVLGYGMKYLTSNSPFLKYANEAVLPFYILHQTVIVSLGYMVLRWSIPDWLKFAIILIASFLISTGIYEAAVRRVNVLRFLFGMKVQPARRAVTLPEVQPVS